MSPLSQFFDKFLPIIQSDLRTVLAPSAQAPELFYRMLHYHMGWVDWDGQPIPPAGGKCIRPVLCLLTCQSVCHDYTPARPAAAAIELIHNFSLLHDDIEDRSLLRRNRPTVWNVWGEQQAINAGDAMFALAHLAIPRLVAGDVDGALSARMLEIIDETCLDLTRGQHLDIQFETGDTVTTDDYLSMIGSKTAALIATAAHLGALAGSADASVQVHYRAFGKNLGLAFQVLDDVLDIWGDPALTGKRAANDIYQRKKTLPVLYAMQHSPELRAIYAEKEAFDEQTVERAVELLDSVDARSYAEELARQYSTQTIEYLKSTRPGGEAGEALFELVDRLLHREY
ncbi:MAG: polyprenyl synthetase family protein [Anaerolineae bacterium]|nr:polyprenyl synthetase family protein [Anaerolineae bacterium]